MSRTRLNLFSLGSASALPPQTYKKFPPNWWPRPWAVVRNLDEGQRAMEEQNLMAMFRGGEFSHRQTDCPVLSSFKGTKNTWGMSNRSWFWFGDQQARAACFTVAEAVCGCGLWPRRQAQLPGMARRQDGAGGPAAWCGSPPAPASHGLNFTCPTAFPGGRVRKAGAQTRPCLGPPPRGEAAPVWSPAERRGRAKPSRTVPCSAVPGRSAVALAAAPRARLSGCGRRGEGSESDGAFPPEKSEVK